MKYTRVVIVLALAVLAAGLVFAQGAPREHTIRAKQAFQAKQRVLRAKACFRQKRRVLRPGIISREQAAKARYLIKRMRYGRRPYDEYTYRGGRHITGRGLEMTGPVTYPKGIFLCRMGERATHPAPRAGGNRGKQVFVGKQMLRHNPMREKLQRRAR